MKCNGTGLCWYEKWDQFWSDGVKLLRIAVKKGHNFIDVTGECLWLSLDQELDGFLIRPMKI